MDIIQLLPSTDKIRKRRNTHQVLLEKDRAIILIHYIFKNTIDHYLTLIDYTLEAP